MQKTKIIGIGTFLPGPAISNEKMEKIMGLKKEWLESMIGNESRYFSVDFENKKIRYTLTDLCEQAALKALENSKLNSFEDIDAIVLSTATPDYIMPSTVNLLADKLNIQNIPTYQIQAGCSGALQALEIAKMYLNCEEYRNVLVVGGDVCNKYLDLDRDFNKLKSSELINYALFGDGAGAAIVTNETDQKGLEILTIYNRFLGVGKSPGQVMNWYGHIPPSAKNLSSRQLSKKYPSASEDYKEIEKTVPLLTEKTINILLQKENINISDINYLLPPQLNWNMTSKIIDYIRFPKSNTINCVRQTGNSGNAIPYVQIEKLLNIIDFNDIALAVSIESSKWINTGLLCQYTK